MTKYIVIYFVKVLQSLTKTLKIVKLYTCRIGHAVFTVRAKGAAWQNKKITETFMTWSIKFLDFYLFCSATEGVIQDHPFSYRSRPRN